MQFKLPATSSLYAGDIPTVIPIVFNNVSTLLSSYCVIRETIVVPLILIPVPAVYVVSVVAIATPLILKLDPDGILTSPFTSNL